jgi:uncharacterized membrane protein YgcG
MTYYPAFDPYSVRERNEGLRREVSTYRLQKQLRQNREPRSGLSNLTASRGFSRSSWRVFVLGGSLLKRAGKEFLRTLTWFFVAYAPLAAILTVFAGVPLREVLVFGGVFVPVLAAVITALIAWGGGPGDFQPRDSHLDHHPGSAHRGFFDGGGYGGGGGGDFGGGGDGG